MNKKNEKNQEEVKTTSKKNACAKECKSTASDKKESKEMKA